ncbi:MAG: glycosyltransferase family 4 protein [Bacteroidetes bacterium]|nr:glycosyltransferase family 4 protein [Bacteroidota bacterium]MBL6944425.1 glycosyltransferase family 4 protein [Bacteroidales bacterium]
MKKVLIITYYWPPSGGGGVQRWVKFVKYLPKFNIEPIVLTVDPDSASYAIIDQSLIHELSDATKVFTTKSREPFNLYKKFNLKKEIPYGGFANEEDPGLFQKISRYIRGNFFIPDARIGWNSFAYDQAAKLIDKFNIETVITSSPPHSTQLIGLKLKKNFGNCWIADLRDPWTDIYYYNRMYHSLLAKKLDKKKETEVLQKADKIIVVSKSIKDLFASKIAGHEKGKINIISNGFDTADFNFNESDINDQFVITYTGTLAENYNIDGFLRALINIVEKHDELKIKLQFVGKVSTGYRDLIENSALGPICSFVGHVDHNSSIAYLKKSSVLFLAIPDVPQNEGILTGKLFEYLAARKPIIGVGPVNGDASVIIDECSAGKMFHYNDEVSIFDYIVDLYLKWVESPEISLEGELYKNYSRENLTAKLVTLIP